VGESRHLRAFVNNAMKIMYDNQVIGESDDVRLVGTECYFPTSVVSSAYLTENSSQTYCPLKGYAVCYDISTEKMQVHNGAWEYRHPYADYAYLVGRIGFRRDHCVD
jgi:uncharacterized protein (DUF427 family)